MKPSRGAKYTSGKGTLLIETITKGGPVTDEARNRLRKPRPSPQSGLPDPASESQLPDEPKKTDSPE